MPTVPLLMTLFYKCFYKLVHFLSRGNGVRFFYILLSFTFGKRGKYFHSGNIVRQCHTEPERKIARVLIICINISFFIVFVFHHSNVLLKYFLREALDDIFDTAGQYYTWKNQDIYFSDILLSVLNVCFVENKAQLSKCDRSKYNTRRR